MDAAQIRKEVIDILHDIAPDEDLDDLKDALLYAHPVHDACTAC